MNNFRKNIWRPIMKSMGIENIGPHALRMSFTTEAADMGMPIHQVSQLDGHSNSRVTIERYLKRNPQAVRDSYALVDANFLKRALKYNSPEALDSQE
jgi:integrase